MIYPDWVKVWHNKATNDDISRQPEEFFFRFIFEYIAFIAMLNLQIIDTASNGRGTIINLSGQDYPGLLLNNIRNKNKYQDRDIIQILKNSESIKTIYLSKVNSDAILKSNWINVIECLKSEPLINSSKGHEHPFDHKYWNYIDLRPANNSATNPSKCGKVLDLDDWANMVEFLYLIRNNLFHGSKSMSRDRDIFLVTHGYRTLKPLVEILLDERIVL